MIFVRESVYFFFERFTFLCVILILFPACTTTQQLHEFPMNTLNTYVSSCSCDIVDHIIQQHKIIDVRQNTVTYDYDMGAFHVKRRYVRLLNRQRVEATHQTDTFTNPFDNKTYLLEADDKQQGKENVVIKLKAEGKVTLIGKIDHNSVTNIYFDSMSHNQWMIRQLQQWPQQSYKTIDNNKTIWHQYPEGVLYEILDVQGLSTRVLQGATLESKAGLVYWADVYEKFLFPLGQSDHYKGEVFLFYMAVRFAISFSRANSHIDECIESGGRANNDVCPANIILF